MKIIYVRRLRNIKEIKVIVISNEMGTNLQMLLENF
jgi:hypothetical protein